MSPVNFLLLSGLIIGTFAEIFPPNSRRFIGVSIGTGSAPTFSPPQSSIAVSETIGLSTAAPYQGPAPITSSPTSASTTIAVSETIGLSTAAPYAGPAPITSSPASESTLAVSETIGLSTAAPYTGAFTISDISVPGTIRLSTAAPYAGPFPPSQKSGTTTSLETSEPKPSTSLPSLVASNRDPITAESSTETAVSKTPVVQVSRTFSRTFPRTSAIETSREFSTPSTSLRFPTQTSESQSFKADSSIETAVSRTPILQVSRPFSSDSTTITSNKLKLPTTSPSSSASKGQSITTNLSQIQPSSFSNKPSAPAPSVQTLSLQTTKAQESNPSNVKTPTPTSASFSVSILSLSPTTLPPSLSTSNPTQSRSSIAAQETTNSSNARTYLGRAQILIASWAFFAVICVQQ